MRPELIHLSPDNIEATAATQIRTKIHADVVNLYTKNMEDGAIFPPLDVFAEKGSERYVLADGFHRHRAYINIGADEIPCNRHEGSLHDALVHALGANETHGFRRSNADKRLAVNVALKDPEISQLSLREIADICRVSHTTVSTIRNELNMQSETEKLNPSDHNTSGETPTEADDSDLAVTQGASQAQVEVREIQQACDLIKALPYSGQDAMERLEISPSLAIDLEYLSAWVTDLVLHYRRQMSAEEE